MYVIGSLTIDCGHDTSEWILTSDNENDDNDGYYNANDYCVGYNPLPNLAQIMYITNENTETQVIPAVNGFPNWYTPFALSRSDAPPLPPQPSPLSFTRTHTHIYMYIYIIFTHA